MRDASSRFSTNRLLKVSVLLAILGVAAVGHGAEPGQAKGTIGMRVSQSGVGTLLIFPYFTTRNGAVTRFTVQAGNAPYLAMHIRLREGVVGRETRGWSVYLPAAGIRRFRIEDDGSAARIFDEGGDGCPAPTFPGGGIPLTNLLYENDGGPSGLDRTREGFAYVLVEAELELAAREEIASKGCSNAVIDRHTAPDGIWSMDPSADTTAPTDGVRGAATIDGIPGRPQVTVPAVAFQRFNNINLHTSPGSGLPNLNSGNPPVAFVEAVKGDLSYGSGAEALSATLMIPSTSLFLGAGSSQWIVTFPTKRFFVDGVSLPPFSTTYNAGFACEPAAITVDGGTVNNRSLCFSTNIVPFNNDNVLGSALTSQSVSFSESQLGRLELFGTGLTDLGTTATLDGLPAIAFPVARDNERNQARLQVAPLVPIEAGSRFGAAVAASQSFAAVSAPGSNTVITYRRQGSVLVPDAPLTVPDGFQATDFGKSLSMEGDLLVVGASSNGTAPKGPLSALQAAVFRRLAGEWAFDKALSAGIDTAGDEFGAASAIEGNMIAVGAPGSNGGDGAVHVFVFDGQSFIGPTTITPPTTEATGRFGSSLDFKNGILAVGSPEGSIAGQLKGAATLFRDVATNLQSSGPINSAATGSGAGFGSSVSLEGNTLVVGAPGASGPAGSDQGLISIFEFDPVNLTIGAEQFIQPADAGGDGLFGTVLCQSGNLIVVGSPGSLGSSGDTGVIYIYDVSTGNVLPLARHAVTDELVESFGGSLACLEDFIIAGAPATNSETGAAFVLDSGEQLFVDGYE